MATFECPHCHSNTGTSHRVQGPDDLQYQVPVDQVRELWQCDECDGYFFLDFELIEVIKLVKEIK